LSAPLPGLRRSLGLSALVSYGLAYVAPITFFTTYGVATEASGGRLALAYLLATSGILLTALSYGHLSAVYPQAGSVFNYASRALHPRLGFLAGWAIALDYLMIPALNDIVIGVFGSALAPRIPAWLWGIAAIALTTAVNLRGIEATDRSARVVLALELLVIAAFLAAAVAAGAGCGLGDAAAEARGASAARGRGARRTVVPRLRRDHDARRGGARAAARRAARGGADVPGRWRPVRAARRGDLPRPSRLALLRRGCRGLHGGRGAGRTPAGVAGVARRDRGLTGLGARRAGRRRPLAVRHGA
jgi:hypothetical protein